jgi:tetratricopeptide (TPR) repeat protein
MKQKRKKLFLYFFIVYASALNAESIKYYTKNNDLYIFNSDEKQNYILNDITSRSGLVIHFLTQNKTPESKKEPEEKKPPTEPEKAKNSEAPKDVDKAKVTKYLIESRHYYEKGQTKRAWESIEAAEDLAPKDYRVLKMKGSLLHSMGDDEEAVKNWNESLKINPNQNDIKTMLKTLNKEATP